jgi:hypothetical protein
LLLLFEMLKHSMLMSLQQRQMMLMQLLMQQRLWLM